jgi:hypothetical protein
MQNWQFELVGLDFVPLGEVLNASSRQVSIHLNKLDTASFRIRMDNPVAEIIAQCEGFIKGWRNGVLVFYGPILTAEENGEASGATLSVNCISGGWIALNKRYANQSITVGAGKRTNMDRAVIVKNEIAAANEDDFFDYEHGVDTTTYPVSSGEAITYTIERYTLISDLLRVMQTGDNTFDWRMLPMDNYSGGVVTGPKHTGFTAAPVLGVDRPEAIWEYGTGRANLQSYRNVVSRETQITGAISLRGSDAVSSTFGGTEMTKWRLMQEVVSTDISDAAMASDLRQAHINTRKAPRRITTWQPHIDPTGLRMPEYGIDYEVGDLVRGRGVANSQVRFDGIFRCWGVDFTVDDNGFERANLILQEEGS